MKHLLAMFLLVIPAWLSIPAKAPTEGYTEPWRCFSWALWDEARGEPLKGARAVLDVIEARMRRDNMTACEVVAKARQFSGYTTGDVLWKISPEALTLYRRAAMMAPVVRGCTHFHATYVHPVWARKMKVCKRINHHIFYKED